MQDIIIDGNPDVPKPLGIIHADTKPADVRAVFRQYGTVVRKKRVVKRNDPCPCGSKQKFKRCCFERDLL